jgi:hypothetical protein
VTDLRSAFARVAQIVFLGALPVGLTVAFLATSAVPEARAESERAIDLHTVWVASADYLDGMSPYPSSLESFVPSGPRQSFVQTAPVAALFAPLSTVSYDVVAVLVPLGLVIAVIVSLWMFGVHDWRCYGATFLSPAVVTSISLGTLTPLVLMGVAVAWRWRGSWVQSALAVGATVAMKLFLWPLVLWLWLSGRRKTALAAIVVALLVTAAAWLPIGPSHVVDFVSLLRRDSREVGPLSYGLASLDPSHSRLAFASLAAISVALVVAAVAAGARRIRFDERHLFVSALIASVLLSPIVHLHYLALLVAVLGVVHPSFGPIWLLPTALWLTPQQDSNGSVWRTIVVLCVIAIAAISDRETRQAPLVARRFNV